MTYTPLQIEIIKKFGRKELMAGCIFKYGDYYSFYCHPGTSFHIVQKLNADTYAIGNEDFRKIEILGHIPHLEDVYRVAKEKGVTIYADNHTNALGIYSKTILFRSFEEAIQYDLYTPLLEQSESTLIELLQKFKS